MSDAPQLQADVAVVGAGAAGLYAALTAAARGRARRARLARRRSPRPRATGRRAGSPRRSPPTTRPTCTATTPSSPGAALVRPSRRRASCAARRRAIVADLERLGVRFDADRDGNLALGLEGGHSRRRVVHAGGSATGRRVVRQLSALVAEDPRIAGARAARAPRAVAARRALRRRRLRGRPRDRRARRRPRDRRRRGAVVAHDEPAGLARHRRCCSRTRPAPRSPTSSSMQFHPTAVTGVPGREGFLVTEAIRGEGATLHDPDGERFVEELAPRDEVARAIDAKMRATGATHVWLDMRAIDPAQFPNVVAALREAGPRPGDRARPGRARGALHDGRRRHRPRRRVDACRACTPSARPRAPACTAPTGSPRTR